MKRTQWVKSREAEHELRRENADLKRQLRIFRSRDQDLAERYQSTPDADGIGGRYASGYLRDKNVPYLTSIINAAPRYPWLRAPDNPNGPPIGFIEGRTLLREHLTVALHALWVAPSDSPLKVRLKQNLLRWVADDDKLDLMMRRTSGGRRERSRLICAAENLAYGLSSPYVWGKSQEAMVEPVEAERRAQPT